MWRREINQRRQKNLGVLLELGRANVTEIATQISLAEIDTLSSLRVMVRNRQVKYLEIDGQDFYELA